MTNDAATVCQRCLSRVTTGANAMHALAERDARGIESSVSSLDPSSALSGPDPIAQASVAYGAGELPMPPGKAPAY
jgi:hypothetical protein